MFIRRAVLVAALLLFTMWTAVPLHVGAAEPLTADALADTLDTLLDNDPTARRTTVTLKVVDLETGEVLYDRGGDKLLVPASNLKIYTAAAALDLLGPGYRWTTRVFSESSIKNGVCNGNLIVRGGGDPMLDTDQLNSIAAQLVKGKGLRSVHGGVIVEPGLRWLDVTLKGPGWMWDDDPDYYNMSICSVMLNFNVLEVNVQRNHLHNVVTLLPVSKYPELNVLDGLDHVGGGEVIGKKVQVTREPFEDSILVLIDKSYVTGDEPVSEQLTMHDPEQWFASVFTQMLKKNGATFDRRSVPGEVQLLIEYEGKTLTEALRHFLKVSENAVGEMVLLKLAETQTEEDVSWPVGAKVISDWLVNTAGLEAGSFRLVDGSGLSRYNLISADSSVKLLAYMKNHEHFEPFFDGLPIYKVDLPKEGKWGGVPFAEFDPERVFAKPGGMSGVSTISGYIKTLDGRWLAFSLLGNGYIGSSKPVRDLRNEVWAELIRYQP